MSHQSQGGGFGTATVTRFLVNEEEEKKKETDKELSDNSDNNN